MKEDKNTIVLPYCFRGEDGLLIIRKRKNNNGNEYHDIDISVGLLTLEGEKMETTINDIHFAVTNTLWYMLERDTILVNKLKEMQKELDDLKADETGDDHASKEETD